MHLKRYFPHKKQNSSIYASYNTLLGLYTLNTRHLLMFKAETLGRMVQQTEKLCLSCTTWHCDNLNKFSFLEFFLLSFMGQSYLILSGNNCSKVISTGHASPARLLHKKGVPSVESSRSVRGLRKGVSGKPYPRLCNARRPRLYRLHGCYMLVLYCKINWSIISWKQEKG